MPQVNEIDQESIAEAMRATGNLDHILAFDHALMEPEAYVAMGSGCTLVTALFKCSSGIHQGAVEAG